MVFEWHVPATAQKKNDDAWEALGGIGEISPQTGSCGLAVQLAATAHAPAATHVNQWNKHLIMNWEKWFGDTWAPGLAWQILDRCLPEQALHMIMRSHNMHRIFNHCPHKVLNDLFRIKPLLTRSSKISIRLFWVFFFSHMMSFHSLGATTQLKEFLWGEQIIHILFFTLHLCRGTLSNHKCTAVRFTLNSLTHHLAQGISPHTATDLWLINLSAFGFCFCLT